MHPNPLKRVLKLRRYDEPIMISASVPTRKNPDSRARLFRVWLPICAFALLSMGLLVVILADGHWPYRYRIIKPMLEEVLGGQVTIAHYHRTYFPNPGFMASGITLDRNPTPKVSPLGTIASVSVQGSWLDLLMFREQVRQVDLTGLHLVIPAPGSPASEKDFPPGSSLSFSGPDTLIEQLRIHDSELDVIRAEGGTYSFPIHMLVIRNLQKGRVLSYWVDLANARPKGHIVSQGSFGPMNPANLGATPLSGSFTFNNVDLHDIGEIGGTLASQGRFNGNLSQIQAEASILTPDFSVARGQPTPVTAITRCTINALSGDVLLDAVDAKFESTAMHIRGGVVGSPKTIDVDVTVNAGRAQDVLRPFLHVDSPIAGIVWLRSHAHVDPAGHGVPFLDRLHVNGSFDVPAERLTNPATEQELSAFSERAQKEAPSKAKLVNSPFGGATQDAAADVISSLKGPARIEKGIVTTTSLEFQIPGASLDLHGTLSLHNGEAHLAGNLRMQSDVSHAATGFKSILLKPLIPFFKKRKAGAVVPILVTGKPGSYKVSEDVLENK